MLLLVEQGAFMNKLEHCIYNSMGCLSWRLRWVYTENKTRDTYMVNRFQSGLNNVKEGAASMVLFRRIHRLGHMFSMVFFELVSIKTILWECT